MHKGNDVQVGRQSQLSLIGSPMKRHIENIATV